MKKLCSVEGCDDASHCKNFCKKHYRRYWKHGSVDVCLTNKYDKICSVKNCEKPHKAYGLCSMHVERKLKYDDVNKGANFPSQTLIDKLMQHPPKHDNCIVWPYSKTNKGYAASSTRRFKDKYGTAVVSRMLLIEATSNRKGLQAAHTCGNSSCVNINHLYWATAKENHADKIKHGTYRYGENHPASKLTEKDVRLIIEDARSAIVIAKNYNISERHVFYIKQRKTWSHL